MSLPLLLAQSAPAAGVSTDLYDCPVNSLVEITNVTCCNRAAAQDQIRVSVSVGGAAIDDKDYRYYDLPLDGNDTFVANIGINVKAGDIVRVRSLNGTTSFSLDGNVTQPITI